MHFGATILKKYRTKMIALLYTTGVGNEQCKEKVVDVENKSCNWLNRDDVCVWSAIGCLREPELTTVS